MCREAGLTCLTRVSRIGCPELSSSFTSPEHSWHTSPIATSSTCSSKGRIDASCRKPACSHSLLKSQSGKCQPVICSNTASTRPHLAPPNNSRSLGKLTPHAGSLSHNCPGPTGASLHRITPHLQSGREQDITNSYISVSITCVGITISCPVMCCRAGCFQESSPEESSERRSS